MATATNIEVTELRRQQREVRRRQVRRRRASALGVLAVLAAAALFGLAQLLVGSGSGAVKLTPVASAEPVSLFRSSSPEEIRGIHITGPLMTLTGKLDSYLAMKKDGLNTIELDLKDESGNVDFQRGAPAIALQDGAALHYYDPREVVGKVHKAGVYLIGRVVTFEDPITARAHPELAVHTSDGSLWHNNAGLGWLNPYSHAAWKYDVDVAVAAAKAGFDEIQFDYVRFPSDGDPRSSAIRASTPSRWTRPSPPSFVTRPCGCTHSACASRRTSSASRRHMTSASASTPGRSARSSMPSTR